ncbi:DUF3097 family protein [Arcanobacterium canis]
MRYSNDVLANFSRNPQAREVEVEVGMLLEDPSSGYVGEVMKVSKIAGKWQMELEDRFAKRRSFFVGPGFWIDGTAVTLVPPTPTAPTSELKMVAGAQITASGSRAVAHTARVARPSRIWVEGKHDAELVAKIWGEDLAYVGIMVEELFGVDHLLEVLEAFEPNDRHRAGVLLDHLVPGSKESRIAQQAMQMPGVLVLGHPYVDVWQAVKPHVVGIPQWPDVPRTEDIKIGTLTRLGWPHETKEDIGLGWKRILDSVHSYTDLSPALLGRMEELIDFVTEGE